ncbi:MAG TPA: hypothetical protein VJJ73_01515, partial [Candidatus Paceibacterota bacterium]
MPRELLKLNNKKGGFGILEIVIVVAIIGIVVFGFGQVGQLAFRLSSVSSAKIESAFIIQEGMEGVRFLRDRGWDQNINLISPDTDYYLTFSGTDYLLQTTTAPLIQGIFTRTIQFSDVYRDAQDTIIGGTSGTLDPSTKKVKVTVSWLDRAAPYSQSAEFYITNLYQN